MDSKAIFAGDVLKGKVALITGGGSGIGFEIATHHGRHGAMVALMGRRKQVVDASAASLEAQGIRAIGIAGDVRKKEDAIRAVQAVVDELGRLDILINGAAGNFLCAAEDLSPNAFKTVLEIDTLGTYTMCHAALHYLKRGGPGKQLHEFGVILNITATLQYTAAWYQLHVAAAKAAIDSMTRSLALEWGTDFGIRVNSIGPGPIANTPGMDKLSANSDKKIAEKVPLGMYGEKWDVAMAAIFLASDAGKYINGALLAVDGGSWVYQPRTLSQETIRSFSREYERNQKKTVLKSKL